MAENNNTNHQKFGVLHSMPDSSESRLSNGMSLLSGFLLVMILALVACNRNQGYDDLFFKADSLMDTHPDSALLLLETMGCDSSSFDKKDRMRWLLLKAKAQNKAFAPMPSDSVFLDVVRYYDRCGQSNDRVLAHYLYGCIARDRNDAPQALERYWEATAIADTTKSDCDYATLLGIYGQMADIYYRQNLPKEEMWALAKAGECSLKAGNVRNYIKCIELLVRPCYELGDTAGIFDATFRAHDLYLKNGFMQEASSVYPTAIFIYLKQGRYKEARVLMDDFEQNSGLFKDGEIAKRQRKYEYFRGMYYEGIQKMDSAEYHYRKVLAYGYPFEGYKGLLSVFSTKGMVDSVGKYAPLYLQSVDDANAELQTEAVLNMRSLYDYTQNKKLADEQKRKSARLQSVLLLLLIVSSAMAIIGVLLYKSYKRKKEIEISQLLTEYEQSVENLDEREEEVMDLKTGMEAMEQARKHATELLQGYLSLRKTAKISDEDDLVKVIKGFIKEMDKMTKQRETILSEKKKEVEWLTELNKSYEQLLKQKGLKEALVKLEKSKIVEVFKSFASKGRSRKPTEKDWEGLCKAFDIHLPDFYLEIRDAYGLSQLELQTILLMCLGISNSDLLCILDKTSQHLTNTKKSANKKIFNEDKASTLRRNLMQKLNSF